MTTHKYKVQVTYQIPIHYTVAQKKKCVREVKKWIKNGIKFGIVDEAMGFSVYVIPQVEDWINAKINITETK